MKKINRIIAIAILSCIFLCGCGNGNTAKTDDKTITIWAWDDNFNVKAANVAKDYYQKDHNDVRINVVSMAQDDIVQKLNTALSSNSYKGLPDIVLVEDYKVQGYLNSYPDEFMDLTSIVNKEDFMKYKLEVESKDNKIYGVPFDSGVTGLFYRTDYIKEAGYNDSDMQDITWDKYIEIGKKVKEKTGKKMLTLDPSDVGQLRIMLQSCGKWYVKEDGSTIDIENNDALKKAITVYKDMCDADIAKQINGWDSFVSAFQKGDVATVPTGCWIAPSIEATKDQKGKWAVAKIPKLSGVSNATEYSSIGGSGWYVLQNVGNKDLAKDFLKETFASNKDMMNDLVEKISLVSTLRSASEGANYNKANDFFAGQKIYSDFHDWTEHVPGVNYGLYTYAIEDIMTEAVSKIVSGEDMDTVLKATQKQVEDAVK